MGDTAQTVVLAILQGLTEFLPISSSAHLLLPGIWLGWPEKGLAFDVAVHAGTLLAVATYFRRDLWGLFTAWCASVTGRHTAQGRLAWLLILATLPAAGTGLLLHGVIETHLRSAILIAWTTVLFALLLWYADRRGARCDAMHSLRWRGALLIGCFQALALVPGVSRAGICLSAGLLLGLRRTDAARFSFLLALPIIAAASGLEFLELRRAPQPGAWEELLLGFVLAALTAHLCIGVFLRLVERIGLLPFVIYRLVLGAALFLSLP